jgi:hypothetical protein
MHETSVFEVEIDTVELKSHQSPGIYQIAGEEIIVCGKAFVF